MKKDLKYYYEQLRKLGYQQDFQTFCSKVMKNIAICFHGKGAFNHFNISPDMIEI